MAFTVPRQYGKMVWYGIMFANMGHEEKLRTPHQLNLIYLGDPWITTQL